MKLKLLVISLSLFLLSCSSNPTTSDEAPTTPIDNVLNDFAAKYPSAMDIQWSYANNYQKASFKLNNRPCTSWYDNVNGIWVCSTIAAPKEDMPQGVKDYIEKEMELNDVISVDTFKQRNMDDLYIVNMKTQGIYLFTVQGYLQRQVDQKLASLPNVILMYINANFNQSALVGAYTNLTTTTVNIIDNDLTKTLLFDQSDNLIWLTWYVSPSNLPIAIKTILASENYSSYYIYKCIYKIYSSSQFYELTLMKEGSAGMTVKFKENGDIVAN